MKPEDVKDWLERHRTGDATAPTNCTRWKKDKLWKKDYNDIIEYLKTRHNRSLCPLEYYACKLYLSKTLSEDELYRPLEELPQYQRFMGVLNHRGENNPPTHTTLIHSSHPLDDHITPTYSETHRIEPTYRR